MSALPCSRSLPWLANGLTWLGLVRSVRSRRDCAGIAIDPFDAEPFLLEQPFVVGNKLGQTLEGRRGFQYQLFFHSKLHSGGRRCYCCGL